MIFSRQKTPFPNSFLPSAKPQILELQEEIDTLTTQQNEARRRAAYGEMKTDESKEYDARRKKISRLVEHLLQLQSFKEQNSSRTSRRTFSGRVPL